MSINKSIAANGWQLSSKNTVRTAIVVGASSGIGAAIALQLAAEGVRVAILGRRKDRLEELVGTDPSHLRPYVHDATCFDSVAPLFDQIVADLGGLDLIVYAAGTMPPVAEGEFSFAKDRSTVEANLLGAMAWLNQAAASFQTARAGTIIGLSSIAGERGRRTKPAYCASKAALTSYLEALRNRLARYGVNVVTVKPGLVDTEMNRQTGRIFWLISAEQAARGSLRLAHKGNGASGYVPRRWAFVAWLMRILPSWIFRKINL